MGQIHGISMVDRDEWYFTNNGKHTVKLGYQVELLYPEREKPPLMFGPTVDVLKAFCWKIRCPPKIKHFMAIGDEVYNSQDESATAGDT